MPALTALSSAVSEVKGTAWKTDSLVACGPPYVALGVIVKAPLVLSKEVSLYGPSTVCQSGLLA